MDSYKIRIKFDGNKMTASQVIEIVSKYSEIVDITIQEPSIESIIKQYYKK